MRSFYGVGYDGLFSRHEPIMADALAKAAAFNTVLDSRGLAASLARQLPDGCLVMTRDTNDEKAFDHHPDAGAWVRHLVGEPDAQLLFEFENEPSVPPLDRLARDEWMLWHTDWIIEGMDALDALGARGVIGNFSTGVPELEDLRGPYRELLQEVADRPQHLLGMHVYYMGYPMSAMTLSMLDRIDTILEVEPRLYGRIVLTETGAEWDAKVPGSAPWKRLYKQDQGRYWGDLQGFYELLRNRGIYGAALYFWREREQGAFGDYDISQAHELNEKIARAEWGRWLEGDMGTGKPIPTESLRPAMLASTDQAGTLIRSGPGKEYAQRGAIPVEGVAGWIGSPFEKDVAGKYLWAPVKIGDLTGWAAAPFLAVTEMGDGMDALRAEIARLTAENDVLKVDAALGQKVRELVAQG